jgi:hypothetical protein
MLKSLNLQKAKEVVLGAMSLCIIFAVWTGNYLFFHTTKLLIVIMKNENLLDTLFRIVHFSLIILHS